MSAQYTPEFRPCPPRYQSGKKNVERMSKRERNDYAFGILASHRIMSEPLWKKCSAQICICSQSVSKNWGDKPGGEVRFMLEGGRVVLEKRRSQSQFMEAVEWGTYSIRGRLLSFWGVWWVGRQEPGVAVLLFASSPIGSMPLLHCERSNPQAWLGGMPGSI